MQHTYKNIAVYIATTQGLVRIYHIKELSGFPTSEITMLNDSMPLDSFSAQYNKFIRPNGVIQKLYDIDTTMKYHMEVDGDINDGQSWQLAVTIAHGLSLQSRLCYNDDDIDHILWLTGKVNNDYSIHPVGHIEQKLERSETLLHHYHHKHIPITLIMPDEGYTSPYATIKPATHLKDILHSYAIASTIDKHYPPPALIAQQKQGKIALLSRLKTPIIIMMIVLVMVIAVFMLVSRGQQPEGVVSEESLLPSTEVPAPPIEQNSEEVSPNALREGEVSLQDSSQQTGGAPSHVNTEPPTPDKCQKPSLDDYEKNC